MQIKKSLPGLGLATTGAILSVVANQLVPQLSALLVAILLGTIVANTVPLPASFAPGTAIASKRVLRIGIVLLGFQLSLIDIASLGWGMILVVVAIVAGGFTSAIVVGRLLKISRSQSILIGAGFSICGAAAVAAVESQVEEREDAEVVTALALVVLFGTLMIPLVPAISALGGLPERLAGLWAGGSIHEVAQVVAAAGIIGPEALKVGVVVKLARVLMLAPLIAVIGIWMSRTSDSHTSNRPKQPLVPLFVAGFIAAAVVRTTNILPTVALDYIKIVQTFLLAAAMFALGLGVKFATLRKVGGRPVILAVIVTCVVAAIAFVGAYIAG